MTVEFPPISRLVPLTAGASGFPYGHLPAPVDIDGSFQENPRTQLEPDVYPGNRPIGSFVWHDNRTHRVRASNGSWLIENHNASNSWTPLEDWLSRLGVAGLEEREMCLAYGSNLAVKEIAKFAGQGTLIALSALTLGASASYCSSTRSDGQFPAGISATSRDRAELHGVLLVDQQQRMELDRKEGVSGGYYARSVLLDDSVDVVLENGERCSGPIGVYAQQAPRRRLAVNNGAPITLATVGQQEFEAMAARLDATDVHRLPIRQVDELPPLLTTPLPVFVYGTLRPGQIRYPFIQGNVSTTRPATVRAAFTETGQDFPGIRPSDGSTVEGVLLYPTPGRQSELLELCDRIEGHPGLFQRALIRTSDGDLAWVYFWNASMTDQGWG